MGEKLKLSALALATALVIAPAAKAAEPNNDFATATGPLTAGQPFNATLETADDTDYQFIYVPDPAVVNVTVANLTKPKDATGGRTLVASVFQARKGKDPLPLADTRRTVAPNKKAKLKLSLVPGKYFIPIGHNSIENGAPNVPFRISIGPAGTTTDSYEIFERRCNDAFRKVMRLKESKKNTADRVAKAKRKGQDGKARRLKAKLRTKRAKIDEAQRIKRIVCSVPQ